MIIIPFVGMIVRNSFRQKEWFLESKIASKGEPRGDQRRPRGGQKEPKEHQNGPKKIIPFVVCQLAFSLPAFSSEKHILIGVALAA